MQMNDFSFLDSCSCFFLNRVMLWNLEYFSISLHNKVEFYIWLNMEFDLQDRLA